MATNLDFPIAEFLAWVRTKPAGEKYRFYDARVCAVAQFGLATGHPELVGVGDASDFGPAVYGAVNDEEGQCTFGALAIRLAALIPAEPVPQAEWAGIEAYLTDIEAVAVSA